MKEKTVTTSPAATVTASFDESGDMFISNVHDPIRCACCGAMPSEHKRDLHPGPRGSNIKTFYCCETLTCPVFLLTRNDLLSAGRWEEVQARIEEVQEEYFAAGEESATAYEHGKAFMSCKEYREKAWKILK